MCVCDVWVHMYMFMHIKRVTSGVKVSSLVAFSLNFWDKVSNWTWVSVIWLYWLSSELQGSSCLRLPSAGISPGLFAQHFNMGAGDLSSDSHACMASYFTKWDIFPLQTPISFYISVLWAHCCKFRWLPCFLVLFMCPQASHEPWELATHKHTWMGFPELSLSMTYV